MDEPKHYVRFQMKSGERFLLYFGTEERAGRALDHATTANTAWLCSENGKTRVRVSEIALVEQHHD
jgi:hypothetical protein